MRRRKGEERGGGEEETRGGYRRRRRRGWRSSKRRRWESWMRRRVNILKEKNLTHVRDVFQYWTEAVDKGRCCEADRVVTLLLQNYAADVTEAQCLAKAGLKRQRRKKNLQRHLVVSY